MEKKKKTQTPENKPANIHDIFFKSFFQDPAMILELLRLTCPGLAAIISPSSLRIVRDSGISQRFAAYFIDLIFEAELVGGRAVMQKLSSSPLYRALRRYIITLTKLYKFIKF